MRKRELAKCVGYLQSCCLALPEGRFKLIELYTSMNSKPGWSLNTSVQLSNAAIRILK